MDRILTADAAVDAGSRLPEGLGTPAPAAADVARSLVSANLAGHDSHGLLRLPWYAEFVSDSRAVPTATPVVTTQSGATAAIDGRQGWGQLAGHLAVDTAAELAEQFGIGIVTAKRCNHIGRLGEYAELLAARGLISMLWCNADPSVAPFGGRIRMLGTDPFAAGIPGHLPLIIDFATAAVAEGKLRIERAAGHRVPLGLIQDAQGRPSTDPEDFYAGGALLPFGAHKGFGLAFSSSCWAAHCPVTTLAFSRDTSGANGLVLIAFAAAALRATPPVEGVQEVLLPGDVERATT